MRPFSTFCRDARLRRHLFACIAILAFAAGPPARAEIAEKGLFGLLEISSDDLSALPMWRSVMDSFPALADAARECDQHIEKCDTQQMTLWRTKIAELKHAEKRIQIMEINRFLNDWKHLPEADDEQSRWITPLEFVSNGGTARDFAVMKYVSLTELGFDPASMRIVIVNDVLRDRNHAVLSIRYRGTQYILDSLNNTLLEERLVTYYLPLYSVNNTTRWAHIPQDFMSADEVASESEEND